MNHAFFYEGVPFANGPHFGRLRGCEEHLAALLKSDYIIADTVAEVNIFLRVSSAFAPAVAGL